MIKGSFSGFKFLMFADKMREKSASTSIGENFTMKLSSHPGAIEPFLGMIEYGPASRIPVELLAILKLKSKLISEVFLIVNLKLREAYMRVGLKSTLFTSQSYEA